MLSTPFYAASTAIALASVFATIAIAQPDLGLTCSDHPSPLAPPSGPLVRSWEFDGEQRAANIIDGRVTYHPRFDGLPYYLNSEGSTSTRFENLDLFFTFGRHRNSGDLTRLHFQRPARVYLFVNAANFRRFSNAVPVLELEGWQSLGWAKLRANRTLPATIRTNYGLHQTSELVSTREMLVFMRQTEPGTDAVSLPTTQTLSTSISLDGRPFRVVGFYHVRVAEADGTATTLPTSFGSVTVQPNQPCPAELHAAWDVPDDNAVNDPDTQGRMFGSWHPLWDPCYWCSYGHEHGSAAPLLMDYKPKYGLTQFKFVRMFNEPNPGFKDFVIELDGMDMIMYVSVHIQTSMLGRVTNPFHTSTIVINRISTRQRLMEISFKADFGFLTARGTRANTFIPLDADGVSRQREQSENRRRMFRSINVIDVNNLDRRFRFIRPDELVGTYEEWVMIPPCSRIQNRGEIAFDILNPITGIDSFETQNPVRLGRRVNNERERRMHVSTRRTIRSEPGIDFAAAHCMFEDFTETQFDSFLRDNDGHFYTDAFMRRVEDGPGPNNVKQFIDPDFSARLQGTFKPDGMWRGMHKVNGRMFFDDHGFGVDTTMN